MIFDTFLFAGELDLLECRLYEWQDIPDVVHILIEGPQDLAGRDKPLLYEEHKDRFAPWEDRIRYLVAPRQHNVIWEERDRQARDLLAAGLYDATLTDVVVHGDVDEIVTAAAVPAMVTALTPGTPPARFRSRMAIYAVDWEAPFWWESGPTAMTFGTLLSLRGLWGDFGFTRLRREPQRWPVTFAGSWHLTWLGTAEQKKHKARSWGHYDNAGWICDWVDSGRCDRGMFWGTEQNFFARRETPLIPRDVDDSWPRWVVQRKCPPAWFRLRETA